MKENVYLRKAIETDMKLLFDWANDPVTRENSFCSNQIPYEHHVKWFTEMMKNPDKIQLIMMNEQHPVGQVRLDMQEKSAVISYSIASKYRGLGYGKIILKLLIEYVQNNSDIEILIAQVKEGNNSSKKCLLYNAFEKNSMQYEYKISRKMK